MGEKIVRTAQGLLRGRTDGEAAVFMGVPFAAPPTGDLRWRGPQPALPWAGIRDAMLPKMSALRCVCDEAETVTGAEYWPFPTYGDLLFGVR